jgi:diguanylate cyclase (GGDEF)-like protein
VQERQRVELALRQANLELERLASLDSLTQIPNRRRFDEYLSVEWRLAQRDQTCLSLILCDVDCFKAYNDCYGHQAGDSCLQRVAQAIYQTLQNPGDLVARYGGEEFAIVLPHTNLESAIWIAEAIRMAIVNLQIAHDRSSVSSHLTVSLGVWSQVPEATQTPEPGLLAADAALYAAKAAGRNCWHVYEAECQLMPQRLEEATPAKS